MLFMRLYLLLQPSALKLTFYVGDIGSCDDAQSGPPAAANIIGQEALQRTRKSCAELLKFIYLGGVWQIRSAPIIQDVRQCVARAFHLLLCR